VGYEKVCELTQNVLFWHTYNNNNDFTAFVWDYPGEPVPEETFTHPPS